MRQSDSDQGKFTLTPVFLDRQAERVVVGQRAQAVGVGHADRLAVAAPRQTNPNAAGMTNASPRVGMANQLCRLREEIHLAMKAEVVRRVNSE